MQKNLQTARDEFPDEKSNCFGDIKMTSSLNMNYKIKTQSKPILVKTFGFDLLSFLF